MELYGASPKKPYKSCAPHNGRARRMVRAATLSRMSTLSSGLLGGVSDTGEHKEPSTISREMPKGLYFTSVAVSSRA
jgi:hypothetical protein